MVLSKRERLAAIGVMAAVGVFALNYFIVDPLLAARADLDRKIAEKAGELSSRNRTIRESREKQAAWAAMQDKGLRRKDDSEAAAPIFSSIRDWASDAGMALSAVKPERSEKEKDFQKLTFRATGSGRMRDISWFLWRVGNSPIPMRVSDVQISAHKEGNDDLSLQIGISTAYLLAETDKNKAGGREATQ